MYCNVIMGVIYLEKEEVVIAKDLSPISNIGY
jgi:hypothetical protein